MSSVASSGQPTSLLLVVAENIFIFAIFDQIELLFGRPRLDALFSELGLVLPRVGPRLAHFHEPPHFTRVALLFFQNALILAHHEPGLAVDSMRPLRLGLGGADEHPLLQHLVAVAQSPVIVTVLDFVFWSMHLSRSSHICFWSDLWCWRC